MLLRNTQQAVKPHFAYYAMAGDSWPCNLRDMHIYLKEFRERMGLTLEQMADRMDVSVSQLSRWESGNNNIPSARLPALAEAYQCRISEIFGEVGDHFTSIGPTLFVKGSVQAGHFAEAWEIPEEEWERYAGRADISATLRERFGLRVVGDSMNAIYPPGTILDCVGYDGLEPIESGKRVIVQRERVGDGIETTVKEYIVDADGIEWLVPRSNNPAFQAPFRCDQPGPDIAEIRIIGIVVASIRPE